MLNRRTVLQTSPLLLGAAFISPSVFTQTARNYSPSGSPLRRVTISDNDVIRTDVGLRPYRRSGFVVREEKLGNKTVVHNYGHGGGGISLSWGTSYLATELIPENIEKRCAVIGCGAVGLASARLMQQRGFHVTIYAKELPPDTTSNIAGAQWSPTSVFARNVASNRFLEQFETAMEFSYNYFRDLVGDRYGIRWITNYEFGNRPPMPNNIVDDYSAMYPGLMDLTQEEHPFTARFARRYETMLIDTSIYLPSVISDFVANNGEIVIREFANQSDINSLSEQILINCTGLGSKSIFPDSELTPIKGQMLVLPAQSEIDYIAISGGGGIFMLPRKNEILLGSTFQRNQDSLVPDQTQSERMLRQHRNLFSNMEDPWA